MAIVIRKENLQRFLESLGLINNMTRTEGANKIRYCLHFANQLEAIEPAAARPHGYGQIDRIARLQIEKSPRSDLKMYCRNLGLATDASSWDLAMGVYMLMLGIESADGVGLGGSTVRSTLSEQPRAPLGIAQILYSKLRGMASHLTLEQFPYVVLQVFALMLALDLVSRFWFLISWALLHLAVVQILSFFLGGVLEQV
ncbi:hypothetical protein NX059_012441 [Plenodomus lindquistii]|nr:hypothetical protein NX059_012441 [Plenodomus lindquistii]